MEGDIDLGLGYSYRLTYWAPDRDLNPQYEGIPDIDPVGAVINCPHEGGALIFENPNLPPGLHDRPCWTLVSLDPLTLTPSILMPCGCHGFITNGRWVPG